MPFLCCRGVPDAMAWTRPTDMQQLSELGKFWFFGGLV
ncbi:MAG: hypothetical protein ACI9TB_002902, partial [Parasphingorhabdus sp.]